MNPSYLSGMLTGTVIGASLIALAAPLPELPAEPQPLRETAYFYTCDNVPPFNLEERGEIRELRQNCQAQEQALLMMKIWEADPTAGQVDE
nr:hypothetical protein [uncultured Kingella sp.]